MARMVEVVCTPCGMRFKITREERDRIVRETPRGQKVMYACGYTCTIER